MTKKMALFIVFTFCKFKKYIYAFLMSNLIIVLLLEFFIYKKIENINNNLIIIFGLLLGSYIVGNMGVAYNPPVERYSGEKKRQYIRFHIIFISILAVVSLIISNIVYLFSDNYYLFYGIIYSVGMLLGLIKFCEEYGAFIKFH